MDDGYVTFWTVVGDSLHQGGSNTGYTLYYHLESLAKARGFQPYNVTERLYYKVKNPIAIDPENMSETVGQIRASLDDKAKYELMHKGDAFVSSISKTFNLGYIYLVIESVYDAQQRRVSKLRTDHPTLYPCLLVRVADSLRWTEPDVSLNGGIFVPTEQDMAPYEIKELETNLSKRRVFDIDAEDLDLHNARHYLQEFTSSYIDVSMTDDKAVVKKDGSELSAFFHLLHYYLPDAKHYQKAKSSAVKAQAFTGNFMHPPFFSRRSDTDVLDYQEEMPWSFPIFISDNYPGILPRKYTPCNDFCILARGFLPLIIGEVISERNEEDRYRMLVQAIALVRVVYYLRKSDTYRPYIVAIYVTANLRAERYILTKQATGVGVYISQKNFNLSDTTEAVDFQREMYNLATDVERIRDQLDNVKLNRLMSIKQGASKIKSVHSSGQVTAVPTVSMTMTSIAEGLKDSEFQDEGDLGVFGDEGVCADLARMNYEVTYVDFGQSNIAAIMNSADREIVGYMKYVKDGGMEIEILQYLQSLPSESNHTVRTIRIWPVAGGSIVAMPEAGNPVTSLYDPDAYLWSLSKQLFEAVKFMHDHNVAHLDLKPSNILVPSEYGRLTVVDFGVSVRLKRPTQLFRGYAGTEGYIAPEVGQTPFSPIRADLWSTGKTVQDLCMLCRPSPHRDWLLALSGQLLIDDPSKRPMMSEVLQRMLTFDAVQTLDRTLNK